MVLLHAAPDLARADQTDDYVRARMDEFRVPGLSLLVLKDGKVVKAAGYGLADVGRRIAAAPDTVYKIASVSKQFIATGVMRLVQEGRLSVDDPVSQYLDGTPPPWQRITVRHAGGLPGFAAEFVRFIDEGVSIVALANGNDVDLADVVAGVALVYLPGAR